jgi:hypothetical protein
MTPYFRHDFIAKQRERARKKTNVLYVTATTGGARSRARDMSTCTSLFVASACELDTLRINSLLTIIYTGAAWVRPKGRVRWK